MHCGGLCKCQHSKQFILESCENKISFHLQKEFIVIMFVLGSKQKLTAEIDLLVDLQKVIEST